MLALHLSVACQTIYITVAKIDDMANGFRTCKIICAELLVETNKYFLKHFFYTNVIFSPVILGKKILLPLW